MILYLLEPEVAGELGSNTIIDNFDSVRQRGERPNITYLHYQFTGWLGDELLECTPCFIVTESLAKTIQESELEGYVLEDVEVSVSDEFKELYPDTELPKFKRLIPKGYVEIDGQNYRLWSRDDFCLAQKSYLVVTEKVLSVLKSHKISYCDISPLDKT